MDSLQGAFDQNAAGLAGRLNIGSVLSRAFSTLFKNPVVFFGLMLIAVAPSTIIKNLAAESAAADTLAHIIDVILSCVVQGATAYGVYCVLRGRTATIGDTISHSMANIIPLVGIAILAGIGVGVFLLFSFVPGIEVVPLFLLIPGIVMVSVWAVTAPACVIEGLGVGESLKRSSALTSGYRWPIFALMLIVILSSIVVGGIVGGVAGAIIAVMGGIAIGDAGVPNVFLSVSINIGSAVFQAFINVMIATIYYDLRMLKEGIGLGRLAKVFD